MNGNITAQGNCIGGIIGIQDGSEITACYNSGTIIGKQIIGGIIGNSWHSISSNENSIIQYSYNTGNIQSLGDSSGTRIGGICGYSEGYTNVEKCYNRGEIIGNNVSVIGGIVGNNRSRKYDINSIPTEVLVAKSQINYTCNIGSINSNGVRIGGICGNNEQYATVKNNYILQGLEIKKGSTKATSTIGASSSYLGKYVGYAYSSDSNYISGNGEITNTITTENEIEDITNTVYYIINGMNADESEYWAKDDVTQPSLKWEALIKY